jgi:MFS family permease
LWLIAALSVVIGVVHMLPGPAMVAAIVDVTPEPDRARAFNLQFWAFNLGTAFAAAIAGVVAEFSFFALFAMDAAVTGLTAVLIWRLVPETLPRHTSAAPQTGLAKVFSDKVFLAFVGLTFVLALLSAQGPTVQLAMAQDGLRPAAFGFVVSLGGAMIVIGQLFVPRLIRGRGFAGVLAFSFVLLGVGYAVVAVADLAWTYLAAARSGRPVKCWPRRRTPRSSRSSRPGTCAPGTKECSIWSSRWPPSRRRRRRLESADAWAVALDRLRRLGIGRGLGSLARRTARARRLSADRAQLSTVEPATV